MKLDDPALEDLLAAYREVTRPPDGERDAIARALDTRLRWRRRSPLVVASLAIAAAIAAWWLASSFATSVVPTTDPRANQAVDTREAVGARELTAPIPATFPVIAPPSTMPEVTASPRAVGPRSIPAAPAPPTDDGIALVGEAQAALGRGDPGAALAALDRHAVLHPTGSAVEERQALRVLALCDLGRITEGRGARGSFLRDHPRSPYRARVLAACPR